MRRFLIVAALLVTTAALAGKPKPTAPPPAAPDPVEEPVEQPPVAPPAQDKPAPVVRYRMEIMEAVGAHMGALGMLVKEDVPRKEDALYHARSLRGASEFFCDLFPEGTGPDLAPRTHARAEIWTDAAGFQQKCDDFKAATEALSEAAKGDDFAAVQEKYREVGQACGACHDGYRHRDER